LQVGVDCLLAIPRLRRLSDRKVLDSVGRDPLAQRTRRVVV
jgi:hypothetical protein